MKRYLILILLLLVPAGAVYADEVEPIPTPRSNPLQGLDLEGAAGPENAPFFEGGGGQSGAYGVTEHGLTLPQPYDLPVWEGIGLNADPFWDFYNITIVFRVFITFFQMIQQNWLVSMLVGIGAFYMAIGWAVNFVKTRAAQHDI